MAAKRGRTIASFGQAFMPFAVDSSLIVARLDVSIADAAVTRLAVGEALANSVLLSDAAVTRLTIGDSARA